MLYFTQKIFFWSIVYFLSRFKYTSHIPYHAKRAMDENRLSWKKNWITLKRDFNTLNRISKSLSLLRGFTVFIFYFKRHKKNKEICMSKENSHPYIQNGNILNNGTPNDEHPDNIIYTLLKKILHFYWDLLCTVFIGDLYEWQLSHSEVVFYIQNSQKYCKINKLSLSERPERAKQWNLSLLW